MAAPVPPKPAVRRLRAFAFDPSLRTDLDAAMINQVTLEVPWEELGPGPVGEYLEVVDYDPASGCFYEPVDLDHPRLLAQDGLAPAEGSPQFHQQMVYAVAMTTIRNFEKALGRAALWSVPTHAGAGRDRYKEVPRLRVYPHALREANAYYSPAKKALLFGYFPASRRNPGRNLPGGLVFTCLSHDIVAHEVTHALLDGLHQRFVEPSNPDVTALHEAFADLVALFQHFTFPEALRHQIARTRGDLGRGNLLAELAQQFGQATGRRGALRSALGHTDPRSGSFVSAPDPEAIHHAREPHARGAILVAAVFDAFLAIYRRRSADLVRLATGGSGELPAGDLHPDLVNRLADEAAKTAGHFLRIVIRALDYCPPVDVTFGDFLRAMVTADHDLVPDDPYGYRIALVEGFRRRGIYPHDVRSLSVENLLWQSPDPEMGELLESQAFANLAHLRQLAPDWAVSNRARAFEQSRESQRTLHGWFLQPPKREVARALGLTLEQEPRTVYRSTNRNYKGLPALEVHSIRPAHRVGPNNETVNELVIELTQKRRGYLDPAVQTRADAGEDVGGADFLFRGGCTVLVNLETGTVRYAIVKRIDGEERLERQRRHLRGGSGASLAATYFGSMERTFYAGRGEPAEPFALLHRAMPGEEAPR